MKTKLPAEDETAVRDLLYTLEKEGYKAVMAVDYQDSLYKFLEQRAEADILAADVIIG